MTFRHQVPQRVLDRFWTHVQTSSPTECWPWLMSIGNHGYGQIGWSENGHTRMVLAHRLAWHLVNGVIPEELTIDHLCRNRRCCNPDHMRLATLSVNAQDGSLHRKGWEGTPRTHCPAGHPYNDQNTYQSPKGDKRCLACARAKIQCSRCGKWMFIGHLKRHQRRKSHQEVLT